MGPLNFTVYVHQIYYRSTILPPIYWLRSITKSSYQLNWHQLKIRKCLTETTVPTTAYAKWPIFSKAESIYKSFFTFILLTEMTERHFKTYTPLITYTHLGVWTTLFQKFMSDITWLGEDISSIYADLDLVSLCRRWAKNPSLLSVMELCGSTQGYW